ncbi:sugar-binding protein [Tengunoibacter tsumagoiensis]|uniref:F5/8 type C domain-containing protein n=1 Tax=Tengunoibacter tsumagoiensis TaxID=2014871 RepID=A0A402A380_9CHLR|nr:sugar-binding protein [Tengunoibacter tsumagoiensis]GCE13499.1 hypothetical protein KTT_33580 [Tengunoibacter tsumagoiensis]
MQSRNHWPNSVPALKQATAGKKSIHAMVALSSLLLLVFSLGAWVLTNHQPAFAQTVTPAMGVNLAWAGDSDGDFLFADAMKTYRLQAAPGQSNPPSVDANGWLQGDFTAFLWDGSFLTHTTGTYALRFNGKANISVGLVSSTITNQAYDAASNTTTATINITQESSANITFTNTQRDSNSATNTGITNVQLMLPTSPGASTSYSFNTTFTSAVKNFVNRFVAIRFMDTTAANGNTETNWSDRALPQRSQEGKASWEYAIQFCNETGKDAYINVPERATDAYITNLANLFKYGSDASGNVYTSAQANPAHPPLNSNLHLYIEFSNELWNGMFQQMHDNHDSAVAEVNAGGSPLNYDGATGDWTWAWRRIGKRIHDISVIFRSVFGDGAMPSTGNAQIRPLLEWQYGNAQDTAHTELSFLDAYYNNGDGTQHVSNPHPVNYFLYGGGGAAYSGVKNASATTIDDMYNSGLDTGVVGGTVVQDVQWASQYGLHDVAYEGGFQIGGDNLSTLQKQANLDPRAQNMEVQAQTTFTQSGGELLMYFDSSSTNYGLAQPTVLDSTPKLQAIDQMNQSGVTFTPTPITSPTPTPAPGQQATITQASSTPTIDGNANDAVWGSATSYSLNNAIGSPSGFSASYQSAWDSTNLYYLVKVNDATFSSHNDMVEVYIDPTNDRGSTYDGLDMQYQFASNSSTVLQWSGGTQGSNTTGITFANATVSGGYQVEIKIPWTTLHTTPSAGKVISMDLDVQQDTTSKNKLFWCSTIDNDWTNPSLFGAGTLQSGGSSTPTPTPTPGGSLPSPWQNQDIGSVGLAGSATANNGSFTVKGSGNDIWDTADAFQYAYQPLNGDGTIVARIDSQQNTDGWAKAGVMIRESLSATSTHALMALTPGNGTVFQRRTSTGGGSSSTAGATATAPSWVKLQRAGNTFTGALSSDGSNWTVVGSDTISMATNVYVGLAVTAHNNSVLNTTTFSQVSVTGSGSGTPSNLSQNKPTTASSIENSGVGPGYAVDGNQSTRWSSLYSDPQWLQVDLGATHQIREVKLFWETAYGKAYQIQVSNDGSNWTTISTQSNGSGGNEDLTGLTGSGRYVRIYATQRGTSWGYSLYEFQVFGV